VAGFSLGQGRLTLETYDDLTAKGGLELVDRWATWDRGFFAPGATTPCRSTARTDALSPTTVRRGDRTVRDATGRGRGRSVRWASASFTLPSGGIAMTITDLPPTAIHRGEEELPFVDIGDGEPSSCSRSTWPTGVDHPQPLPPDTTIQTHKHTGHVLASPRKVVVLQGVPDVVTRPAPTSTNRPVPYTPSRPATNEGVTDVWFAIHGANLNLDADGNVEMVIDATGSCLLPGRMRRTARHATRRSSSSEADPVRAAVLTDERPD